MKVITTLIALSSLAYLGLCDAGVATTYKSPYLPTRCHGNDQGQFPPEYLFAAIGPGQWNNGAACDRHYIIRCTSPIGGIGQCKPGYITVKIVEGRLGNRAPDFSIPPQAVEKIYTGAGRFKIEFGEA
ncbi:hypothetical protein Vi05172_g6858 [Venturia inaequalis]|uniref:Plant natriuretic peptide-like 9 n=1 Tax=Venturia inaequalis TaxID=5025 RepID=A0A370JAU2_VENIN|nr:plant natriuretic peptide-like 9 [Venturia inaequalis]RDI83149.1 hypothetical protein Vi05172_g6858 [Venturia inaequalis]